MLFSTHKLLTPITSRAVRAAALTSLILISLFAVAAYAAPDAPVPGETGNRDSASGTQIISWQDLRDPVYLTPDKQVVYYNFAAGNGSRVHLVVADYKSGHYVFKPVLAPIKTPVSVVADQRDTLAAVNAAYFNLSDGLSVGYIYAEGNMIADPHQNPALYENTKLKPYLPAIYNRTELRFLKDTHNESQIQIARHLAPLPSGCKLVDSIQAGPRLLPELTEEQEAFVRKDPGTGKTVDAINSHKCAARTAFGITNDGYALMLCAASPSQNPESAGVTLSELADIMRNLGCTEAINFDGGASATMAVNLSNQVKVVCGKTPETRVKSVLMLHAGNQQSK